MRPFRGLTVHSGNEKSSSMTSSVLLRHPSACGRDASTGASLATTFPRFVIRMVSPSAATSSMSARHVCLNSAALIVLGTNQA